jgi:hypothetical protein
MNVGELKRALEEAQDILSAAGAKTAGKDLNSFLQIFAGREHEDINVFFDELRRLLSTASERRATSKVPDTDRVNHYVTSLESAGTDKAAFSSIYSELTKDKALSKEDADAIAHRFTGGRATWPSKGDALLAVKQWFDHKAYQAVKMQQVDRGTAWKPKRA